MRASEIRELAAVAGLGAGVSVLDLCCGVAGPGRHLVETFAPRYLGVDADAGAVRLARSRTRGLDCAFVAGEVPPLPRGPFDVVLLLETFLAFEDKGSLVRSVAEQLRPGGRFGFTLEDGAPLTRQEREQMPEPDTVRLVPFPQAVACLEQHGFRLRWHADVTTAHLAVASALVRGYEERSAAMAREIGSAAVEQLLAAHRVWVEWMAARRVRKVAVVAEKVA
jgi:SAM-dependent methyltransferase